jgi:hypothetical protein
VPDLGSIASVTLSITVDVGSLSKPCLIWIDESPIDAALVGVSVDGDDDGTLPLDTLRRPDPIAGMPDAAGRLHELRGCSTRKASAASASRAAISSSGSSGAMNSRNTAALLPG